MNRTFVASACLLPVLIGCSAAAPTPTTTTPGAPSSPAPASSTSASTPSLAPRVMLTANPPTASQSLSPQRLGRHFEKQVGSQTGLMNQQGEWVLTYSVTKIQPDFVCTAPGALPPANGHYLAAYVVAEMPRIQGAKSPAVSLADVLAVGPDKRYDQTSERGNAASCLKESDRLPAVVKYGDKVQGYVVLDARSNRGWISTVLSRDAADYWWVIPG